MFSRQLIRSKSHYWSSVSFRSVRLRGSPLAADETLTELRLDRDSFYQLRQIRPMVRALSMDAAATLIQAFVSISRLDYCNWVLNGITENLFQRLQSVQNATATQTGRREHITPVLRQLYWLPVRRHVEFKLAVLVYKALHGQVPPYLSDDCLLMAEVGRRLRSADARTCVVQDPVC